MFKVKIFDRVKSFMLEDDPPNVAIIGYTQAGKSTFVKQLQENKILSPDRDVTHSMKDSKVTIDINGKMHTFIASDSGGQELHQKLVWKNSVARASGIVYVIDLSLLYNCSFVKSDEIGDYKTFTSISDSCGNKSELQGLMVCKCEDNAEFVKSRMAKSMAYSILDKGKPILVLFNKVDLKDTLEILTPSDLTKLYGLGHPDFNENLMVSSALVGTNVKESITWLLSEIEKRGVY